MANQVENKYVYTVRNSEHLTSSRIEASSAQEAIDIATRNLDDKCVIEVKAEKMFKASIDVEDDSGDEGVSENAVMEISIKGTDPARVDALKKAIGYLISGPHHGDETEFDPDKIGETRMLEKELAKVFVIAY